ncbi:MAG TPA: PD-(D/E)XK nuclease family protein, partial [Thermoanaerobaculia bacterium]|nr:PD-(D/E)XK nuclease family protein [Thermoanaerobaculia bacterium]
VLLGGMAGGDAAEFGLRALRQRGGGVALHLGRGRNNSLGTRGHQAAWEDERARQTAEDKRLLYVATTRARDLLVLPALRPGVKPPQPMSSLFTLLTEAGAARPESLPQAPAARLEVPDLGEPPAGPPPRLDLGRLDLALGRDLAGRRAAWSAAERRALAPAILRPSDADPVDPIEAVKTGEDAADGSDATVSVASTAPNQSLLWDQLGSTSSTARIGRAAHALLAAAMGSASTASMGSTAPEPPLPLLAGEREEAERLARRFLDSELARRARAAPEILIEEPLTLPFSDGRLLDGVLDLAFLEPGGWVLVDYKSDRVAAAELPARAARYRLQLALYAHAIARLTGRPVAEAHLFFLDTGTSQRYGPGELEPVAEAVGATGDDVTSAAPTISSAGSSAT